MFNYLEQKFKFDVRYLLKSGFFVMVEYFVSASTGVFFGFLVANILDPNQYGIYKYILSLLSIVAAFTLTGLSTSLLQAVAKGFEGTLKPIAKTQLKWSLPALFVGSSISLYYFLAGAYMLGGTILFASMMIPLRDVGNLSVSYLGGKELFGMRALLNTVRTITGISILIVILFVISDAKIMVFAQYAVEAIGFLIMLWFVIRTYPPNKEIDIHNSIYGKHLSAIDIIQKTAANLDKVFVFQVLGPVSLAAYSIALMPVSQLMSFNKSLRTLIAPRFAKRSFHEIHATIFNKVFLILLVSTAGMMAYIVTAPFLFKHLLPQYVHVIPMAQIASITLLSAPKSLFAQVLVAHSCKKELYVSAIVGSILMVVFMLIGWWFGGLLGVLIAFVCGRISNMLIALFAYLYAYKTNIKLQI